MKRAAFLLICSVAVAQDQAGQWSPTGALLTPRRDACLVSLQDGRLLAAGGIGPEGTLHGAEIYSDPAFTRTAPMMSARSAHTCTVLPDGRVLAVGGREGDSAIGEAEIFDPDAASWSAAANAPIARWGHTATMLPDGSVLIAGGENESGATAVLERFDPIANTFTTLSSTLAIPRRLHAAAALPDGRVLVAGGNDGFNDLYSVELVDPIADSVIAGPNLPELRSNGRAVTLMDGRVLLVGGSANGTELASTLIFDPAGGSLTAGPMLAVPRAGVEAIRIPNNGNVLVIGGTSKGAPTPVTELFDAVRGQFLPFGNLTLARDGVAAAPIGDSGSILAAGGDMNGVPVAACGKTNTPATVTSDKTIYTVGQTAVLTGTWGVRKEDVTIAVKLTPLRGAPATQSIIASNVAGSFSVSTNPLTGPSTALVTAVGAVTGITVTTSFQVDVTSTTSLLPPSPASPALVRAPVTMSAKVHPPAANSGPMAGNVLLFDGATLIGNVSTFDSARFHIDSSGDGTAVFSLTNGFTSFGLHNLTAKFQAVPSGFVASSATPSPLIYAVDRRTAALSALAKNPPPRIHENFDLLIVAAPAAGLPSPTGNVSVIESSTTLGTLPLAPPPALSLNPATSADLQIVGGAVPGPRTFTIHYQGDAIYAPETITHVEEMKGVIPNLRVNSVTPEPGGPLAVDGVADVSVTFTPVPGIDPWVNSICPASACEFSYQVSANLQQNGISFGEFGPPINLPNVSFFGFAPDANGRPITVTLQVIPRAVGPATLTASLSCIVAPGPVSPLQNLRTNYDCFTTQPFSFTVPNKGPGAFTATAKAAALPNRVATITVDPGGRPLTGTFQLVEGTTALTSTQIPASATLSGTQPFTLTVAATAGLHTYSVLYSGDANYNPSSATVNVQVP